MVKLQFTSMRLHTLNRFLSHLPQQYTCSYIDVRLSVSTSDRTFVCPFTIYVDLSKSIQMAYSLKPLHSWFSNFTYGIMRLQNEKIQSVRESKMAANAENCKTNEICFFLQNGWVYLAEILQGSLVSLLGFQKYQNEKKRKKS